jgi:hypothetical protein
VVGISRAAPMPWMARLPMSTPPLPASPAALDGQHRHVDDVAVRSARRHHESHHRS